MDDKHASAGQPGPAVMPSPSRRDLLRGAASLGASALLGGTLMPFGRSAEAEVQAPRKGGVARLATEITDATATLDPPRILTNTDIARGFQIYNGLVRIDEKLEVQPVLAESWEMAKPDATEWVFKLRRGVTFHNGKTLTSADVVWNLRRHLGAKSESRAKSMMADVRDVQADGPDVVRVTLARPNAEFPVVLALPYLAIAPEGYSDYLNPVGTGPFKMKEFTPGGGSMFVRNEQYWNAANVFLDAIEVVAIADPVGRLNGVLAGDLDFAMSADVKALPLLEKSDSVEKVYVRAGQIVAIDMQCDRAPTSNADFRMALKLLQDRQKVKDSVYKGYAQIGNDHPVSPVDPMYCAHLPIRAYDLDKARFHLKKAGMEGAQIEIYVAPGIGPGLIDQMLTFQQTATPAGLKVKVNQVPGEGYWTQTWMKFPLTSAHKNMRPRSDIYWSNFVSPGSKNNETKFQDPRIDDLLNAARSEIDVAKRKQHWADLQTIIHQDGGYMLAAFPDYLHSKSKKLHGLVPHPTAGLSDFLSGEGLWLES